MWTGSRKDKEVDLKLCTVFVVYKNEQPAVAVSSSHAAQQ